MLFQLQKCHPKVTHTTGKGMLIPDMFSRDAGKHTTEPDDEMTDEKVIYAAKATLTLPTDLLNKLKEDPHRSCNTSFTQPCM